MSPVADEQQESDASGESEDGAPARASAAADARSTNFGVGLAARATGRRLLAADFSLARTADAFRLPARLPILAATASRRPRWSGPQARIDAGRTSALWARLGRTGLQFAKRPAPRAGSRLVVLWDVSGSMSEWRSLFLQLSRALVASYPRVGVFAFAMRVSDITPYLTGSQQRLRQELASLEQLWAAGTDIGGMMEYWLDAYGSAWVRPGTVVLVVSDGWDAGAPQAVARAGRRLRAAGARLYWLNPLASTPGFTAKTRALVAIRPYLSGLHAAATAQEVAHFFRYVT